MKTLVFVHGYLGGGSQWAAQKVAFGDHFQVITPDLPGFGDNNRSTAPETIRGFAINVFRQLDALGVHRFHLAGHSMGGMIVQEMVALAPERIEKLVLYGTGPLGLMPGRFETIDESRRAVQEQGVETTGRRIAATWFMQGESGRGYDVCADLAVKATLQAALAGLTAMESWSGVAALPRITAPTLVMWGDGDRAYLWPQPEQLWHGIKGAQLAVIPGCAHAIHLEKPHLFNATLADFLLES
ncbi:MAG TPA: alpha/beta hydrolase [Gammaproteobacteria bacterium]|nr:alpha/beta hydrolase [Gammaproteobacteria bacterium]